jgi:8-oxo-dGTP diphosphatase
MIDRETGWYFLPTSVKGVVRRSDDEVLLCYNPRHEWELPGGWPDPTDSTIQAALTREIREESSLDTRIGAPVAVTFIRIGAETIILAIFEAQVTGINRDPAPSHEHSDVQFFRVDQLPENMPDVYRQAILATCPHATP